MKADPVGARRRPEPSPARAGEARRRLVPETGRDLVDREVVLPQQLDGTAPAVRAEEDAV